MPTGTTPHAMSWSVRLQVAVRATVAALIAWQACRGLPGDAPGYPAAIAALLSAHPTAFRSFTTSAQYAAGCALGAAIALPVMVEIGPGSTGLIVVTLASTLVASSSRLGHSGGLHVPTTAVLVLLVGRGHFDDESLPHLAEIIVGLVIGILCNTVLFPPLRLRTAETALERLRVELARALADLAHALTNRESPGELYGPDRRQRTVEAVEAAHAAVTQAHESRRWNLRPSARHSPWHLDHEILHALTRVADNLTEVADTLEMRAQQHTPNGEDDTFAEAVGRLLRCTGWCVRGWNGGLPHPLLPAARRAWERLAEHVEGRRGGLIAHPQDRRLLLLLDHLLEPLADGKQLASGRDLSRRALACR